MMNRAANNNLRSWLRCWWIYWTARLRCRRGGPGAARRRYWNARRDDSETSRFAAAEWWGNTDGIADHYRRSE